MRSLVSSCMAVGVLLLAAGASAQTAPKNFRSDVSADVPRTAITSQAEPLLGERQAIGPTFGIYPPPPFDPAIAWREEWICRAFQPAEVTGFSVTCNGATFLDFHTTDCCIPGDHWQLKGKIWDTAPNTGVTTSPGPVPVWSVPGRAYNYGGTPWSPGHISAYVECTVLHGVDVFPADSVIWFSSDGNCVVAPDPARNRIDRAP